jgi:AcrR family transcriptional regulator
MVHAVSPGKPPADESTARLQQLVDAATDVFATNGYRRTQMAAVAMAAGVSPGTLYNYVESKEALFRLVIERSVGPLEMPAVPVGDVPLADTIEWLRRRLDFGDFPELAAATASPASDAAGELRSVFGELFDVLTQTADAVEIMTASAVDLPELGAMFLDVREELIRRYTSYLLARYSAGGVAGHPDWRFTAHLIVALVTWAVRGRRGDAETREISTATARSEFVAFVTGALTMPDGAHRP